MMKNYFIKFILNVSINITDKRLINILDNILLPKDEYEKLVSNILDLKKKWISHIWSILFRYQILDLTIISWLYYLEF